MIERMKTELMSVMVWQYLTLSSGFKYYKNKYYVKNLSFHSYNNHKIKLLSLSFKIIGKQSVS